MKEQMRQQMEEAVAEIHHLLSLFDRGVLEQQVPGKAQTDLRFVLRDRELWQKGGIFLSSDLVRYQDAEALRTFAKRKLEIVEDGAKMHTKTEAIEYLRALGHFGCLNHEPLRKVEREWLDRIFVLERHSAEWIELAAAMASAEEHGIHVEDHIQVPCRCRDSVDRRRSEIGKE